MFTDTVRLKPDMTSVSPNIADFSYVVSAFRRTWTWDVVSAFRRT